MEVNGAQRKIRGNILKRKVVTQIVLDIAKDMVDFKIMTVFFVFFMALLSGFYESFVDQRQNDALQQ